MDYNRESKRFLESNDPDESYGLPGWKLVSAKLGTDRSAKELFVVFQNRFSFAMQSLDQSSKEIERAFAKLGTQEIDSKRSSGISNDKIVEALICALVLAESVDRDRVSMPNFDNRIANWLMDYQLRSYFSQASPYLKKLVGSWLGQGQEIDTFTARRLMIAINLGFKKQGWRLSELLLAKSANLSSSYKYQAILFIRGPWFCRPCEAD